MKACHTGAAYLCTDWTKEKDWTKRRKQYYCTKCGRPIELNPETCRWRHIKSKRLKNVIR